MGVAAVGGAVRRRLGTLSLAATAAMLVSVIPAGSVANAAPPPAPTGVSVSVATTLVAANNGRFTVSWAPVTGALAYRVVATLAGVERAAATVSAPATSGVLTGLIGGTRYQVSVKATNADGYGASSTPQDATAVTVPDAPENVITAQGDDTVLVSWGAPTNNGGAAIEAYKVEQRQTGGTYTTLAELEDDSFSYVVTGDDKPLVSDYRITAKNAYGWSGAESSTVPPNAPRNLARTLSGSSVTATWQAPLVGAGQAAIAGYVIQVGGDTQEVSASTLTYTKGGLADGTYALAVAAFDVEGNEGAAASSTFTITGGGGGGGGGSGEVSNPPTNVQASAGDASATVSWTAPAVTGSFPVTNYRVTSTPVSAGCVASTTSCKATGLTNGTTYTFTVAALNGAGYSKESSPSNAVIPRATPGPTPTPTPSPSPSPSPTVEIDAPARVVAAPGDDVRIVLEPSSRIKSSLLRALIVVQGKNRPLDAAFRNAGKNIILTFEVNRKPGTYKILIGQRIQGDFAVLGQTKLVVRKGRRIRS